MIIFALLDLIHIALYNLALAYIIYWLLLLSHKIA